jgi:hypothetical protein
MPKLIKKKTPNLNKTVENNLTEYYSKPKVSSELKEVIKTVTNFNQLTKPIDTEVVEEPINKPLKTTKTKISKISKFIDDAIECRICGDEFKSDDEKEPLACGHFYHYDCIIYAFQSPSSIRQCPYCRKYHGYLRLMPGINPLKHVHKEHISIPKNKKVNNSNIIHNKCIAILTTGYKAGSQCNFKSKYNSYCGIHKNLA